MLFLLAVLAGGKLYSQGCAPETTGDGVNIFGFLQSQYQMNFQDPTKHSFSFERARIGTTGKIPYDFSYYVVLELSPFISNNPYLLDAYVSYEVQMGKTVSWFFQNPFWARNQYALQWFDHFLPLNSNATNGGSVS